MEPPARFAGCPARSDSAPAEESGGDEESHADTQGQDSSPRQYMRAGRRAEERNDYVIERPVHSLDRLALLGSSADVCVQRTGAGARAVPHPAAGLLLVGLLLLWIVPAWRRRTADTVQTKPLPNLGWGMVACVAFVAAVLDSAPRHQQHQPEVSLPKCPLRCMVACSSIGMGPWFRSRAVASIGAEPPSAIDAWR